ncbi:MAG: diguanylate cyclase response regulator [Deltaproteobacteria bacterium HGW-Deltaproteobacteria-3]|jgi:diguanylate cyclase (GGDEF)-like protein|nr:MAG: diguanylate cyclase response regulator [Deltaproteobacteria bacterium HGW-Deltaproteobacteria-3]
MKEKTNSRQLLLVEDSKSLGLMVKDKIEAQLALSVSLATSFAEARRLIADQRNQFFLAILDLTLPDASGNEVVDYVLTRSIPPIIFAGRFNQKLRSTLWQKMIVDYVLKENPQSIDYLLGLVRRIANNSGVKALVVDDSRSSRLELSNMLTIHRFCVYEAENGAKALPILEQHPDIKLLITDNDMPTMTGLQLTKEIRHRHAKDELAIIGLSATGDQTISAQFIKNGANDFLSKPFSTEEFYCRVNQNMDLLDYIRQIKESSNRDYLTGLYNRRYFFEMGKKLLSSANRGHITVAVALLDIDFFKKVNDTHGHDAGDLVLKNLGAALLRRFRETDIVCRYGGEEICILVVNMAGESIHDIFNGVRKNIAQTTMDLGREKIRITVSIGLCVEAKESLEEMITIADEMLYAAKENGRNQVRF